MNINRNRKWTFWSSSSATPSSKPQTQMTYSNFSIVIFILCYILDLTSCGKILIIHPLYSGSHVLTLRSVAETLTKHGHQIHIIRWRDAHVFPIVNNPNITVTTLAMDNSHGQFAYLTQEKQAAFQVSKHKNT
jgi:hypothetical protein